MFRKVLAYIGWTLLTLMVGAYFYFASTLEKRGKEKEICRGIRVVLLDSSTNRFVTANEVVEIIEQFSTPPVGKNIDEIELEKIESLLCSRSAIKSAQASVTIDGTLNIEITQRRPLLRIEGKNGGFYIDDQEYIFPLSETHSSYVPVVTGDIPLLIEQGHRGTLAGEQKSWAGDIVELGLFLRENSFWNAMVEQISIAPDGDVLIFPKVGSFSIVLGDLKNIEDKFERLYAFYRNVAPYEGWEKYSSVSVKYKDQIVCKLKNNKASKRK